MKTEVQNKCPRPHPLLKALCSGSNRLCIMLRNFSSYCDEFGHPDDPNKKYMGIAGLLGWSDNWKMFTDEWEECLRVEKIPHPFHMTDFVHHSERFSSRRWEDRTERSRVLDLLLNIIKKADVIPIGATVVLKDYKELTREQQSLCKSPYYLAFQAVTSNMGFAAASMDLSMEIAKAKADVEAENAGLPVDPSYIPSPAIISMVYAKLKKYTGPAEQLWNAIRDANMFGRWMGSYTVGDPADSPPLQAADIWAYSLGHLGEYRPPKNTEAETACRMFVAQAMKATHGAHWFTYFDRKQILIRTGQFSDLEKP
jgi:hypothetical protein